MLGHIIRRILGTIPTLLALITVCFFMMRLAPGGPFDGERALPPEIKANLLKEYHLDEPVYKQYFGYLNNLLHGNLGPSFKLRDWTVNQLVAKGFPVSLKLGLSAIFWAFSLGVIFGCLAAFKHNAPPDYAVMGLSTFGVSVPNFVVGPVLVLIFAITFRLLPAGGWAGGQLKNMILPVTVLTLPQMAIVSRIMRASMIEVLNSPYIRTARAKGLSFFTIITRHALKPAIIPVISYLGPATAAVITGSVVVEQIFALPGIGTLLVQSATNRDYTTVLGLTILFGVLVILFNLLVDILYTLVDPKIRYK